MTNREHLEILEQGVEVWNEWRNEHPEIRPNLTNADLSEADFSRIDLNHADLSHANLSFADLSHADLNHAVLYHANLFGADFSHVNLRHADLSDATFVGADLRYADLRDASLRYVTLNHAFLRGANLTNCALGFTILGDINLGEVKGLESVNHDLPSTIGIDSIYRSRGEIPEVFLRGCGVPEIFITYMRSLVMQAIQFYSCFISYSSKDQLFASRLYADLQNKGVRCWLATEDLKIGDRIRIGIDESIRIHDKMLLVLSKDSVASDWVEQEVETALARERKEKRIILFPIRLDETVTKIETGWPALIKNTRHIGDFRKWKNPEAYQKAFDRLLRDLKAEQKD